MVKCSQSILSIGKKSAFIIGLIVFFISQSGYLIANPPTPDEGIALISIEVHTDSDIPKLSAFVPKVYTQMYTTQGDSLFLIAAGKDIQEKLSKEGFAFRVLDPNIHSRSYYLLYGLPEDLYKAQAEVDFLLVQDRQAVASITEDGLEKLVGYGIDTLPLIPQELSGMKTGKPARNAVFQAISQNSLVQEIISRVDSQTLIDYVGNLSGEGSVIVNGSSYRFATRYTYAEVPIKKATRYIFEHFQSLGLPSGYDYYYINGLEKRNVLAQKNGASQSERIILLCAHLDSTSYLNGNPQTLAPGADDNASGSAALMHIAEILNQYTFDCSLRYALFTGEEQGMYGSKAYAQGVYNLGENIDAVLNLDMIAYNTAGTSQKIELHTRPGNADDLAIANLFNEVIFTYDIDLDAHILQDGLLFSDHSSFWNYGYPAILAIEDWSDHTPYYHMTTDRLNTLNMSYYTEFVKASIAALAHIGCLVDSELKGTVTDAHNGGPLPDALVEIWKDGALIETTITRMDGTYESVLHPGNYHVVFSALDHLLVTYDDVQISSGEQTILDISLQPCIFIKQVDFTFSPLRPEVDQATVYTGTVGIGDSPISYSWNFGDDELGTGQIITHTFSKKGSYAVLLEANNTCQVPASIIHATNVNAEYTFLPLIQSRIDN